MTNPHTSELAQQAALLLRTGESARTHPEAAAIADAAARLLGVGDSAPGVRMSAFERRRSAMAASQREGFAARLRRLFGGKQD